MLTTIEELFERHIKKASLMTGPLYPYQHAFQSGKSYEIEFQQLVVKTHLTEVLDIENAFDDTPTEESICKLINTLLIGRKIRIDFFVERIT